MKLASLRRLSIDLIFFATGFGTVLLGVLAPLLFAGRMGDAAIAQLFFSQFLGSIAGNFLLWGRPSRSLQGGLGLCALGALMLIFHTATLGWLFLFGAGLGLSMTSANLVAAHEATAAERASRLEFINFAWAVGAMICPWATIWASNLLRPAMMYGILAGFLLLLGVAFSWAGAPAISVEEQEASQPVFDPLTLALCCLLGLLAVGVESSVGNWIPTLAFRESAARNSISLTSSLFWVGIVAGRLFASKTTRSIAPRTLGVLNSLLALASVLLIIRVHGLALLSAGGFLAAFWISSIYPLAIARAVPLKGRRWLFIVAGLGSSFMPWLTGIYSQRWGSLRLALALPATGCLLLAGLFVMSGVKRQTRPRVRAGSSSTF